MITYPNQKAITIKKQKAVNDFLQIANEEWMAAYKDLAPSSFALYLYLAANANNYTFMIAPSIVKTAIGISETTYRRALKELENKRYVVSEGGSATHYFFYTTPAKNGYTPYPKLDTPVSKNGYNGYPKMDTENIYTYNNIYIIDTASEKMDMERVRAINEQVKEKEKMMSAVKQLRDSGKDWGWIREAFERKTIKVWDEKGYGLLFFQPYQVEIDAQFTEPSQLTPEQEQLRSEDYVAFCDSLDEKGLAEETVRWNRENNRGNRNEKTDW